VTQPNPYQALGTGEEAHEPEVRAAFVSTGEVAFREAAQSCGRVQRVAVRVAFESKGWLETRFSPHRLKG
jgi:hypothetical protein